MESWNTVTDLEPAETLFRLGSFPTSFRTGTQKIATRRKENSMTNSFRLTDSPLLPPCLLRSALWRLFASFALCRSLEPQLATDACTKNMRPRLLRQPRFQYVFRQRRISEQHNRWREHGHRKRCPFCQYHW